MATNDTTDFLKVPAAAMINPFDAITATIFAYCLIRGIFQGLLKEISGIIGVFGGFYAAYTYYLPFSKLIERWITTPAYLYIVSFLLIFFAVFLLVSLVGVLIKKVLNITFLGWVDRLFGAVFGSVKAALIVSVILFILTTFLPQGSPLLKQSVAAPHIAAFSETMSKVVSKEMKTNFEKKIRELKDTWKAKGVQPLF